MKSADLTEDAKNAIQTVLDNNKIDTDLIASEQQIVEDATKNLNDALKNYEGSFKIYTVTFVVNGVKNTQEVISGNNAEAPEDPETYYDENNHYDFVKWDKDYTNIKSDLTVTAEFETVKHTYTHADINDEYHTDACACGYQKDVKHSYTSVVTTKASCFADGKRVYTCSLCQGTKTEIIYKRAHTMEDTTVAVPATCKATGTMNQKCKNTADDDYIACDHIGTRTIDIDPDAHKWESEYSVDKKATCEENGSKSLHCEYCDDSKPGSSVTIEKRDHNYTDNGVKVYADCLNDGVMNTICTNEETETHSACSDVSTRVIPASGHNFGATKEAVEATCEKAGNYAYKQCGNCKLYFSGDADNKSTEGKADTTTFVIDQKAHSFTGEIRNDGNSANATHSFKCVNGCNDFGAAVKHDWNDGETITDSTCTTVGEKKFTCETQGCGATYTAEIALKDHRLTETKAKDATCTENGNINYWYCSACKQYFSDAEATTVITEVQTVVNAIGHSFGATKEAVEATCENAGNYAYKQCGNCKLYFAEDADNKSTEGKADETTFVINQKEHSYTGGEYIYDKATNKHKELCVNGCNKYGNETNCSFEAVVTDPTCDVKGYTTHTCTVCGNNYTDTETSREHIYVYAEGNGENHKVTCEYDNCAYEEYKTCSGGTAYCNAKAVCDMCGAKYGSADASNHTNLVKTAYKAATCTENGNKEYWTCDGCRKLYSDETATTETTAEEVVIGAIKHNWGDWTFVEDGEHKRVCGNDNNHVEKEACADSDTDDNCLCDKCNELVAHTYSNATCDAPATCIVCKETTGGVLGHDWADATYTWAEDGKVCTAERVCKRDAAHKETATADITSQVKVPSTCTANGTTTYTATFSEEWASMTQTKDVVDIAMIDHDYTSHYVASTCTREGYSYKICKNCGKKIDEISYKELGHNYSGETIIDEPTCTEPGREFIKCTRCDEMLFIREIDKTGHHYITLSPAVDPTCDTPGKKVSRYCAACGYEDIGAVIPALGHKDEDGNEKCDVCSALLYNASDYCKCMCHNDSGIMKIIYSVVWFFWKLFKINPACACGFEHY